MIQDPQLQSRIAHWRDRQKRGEMTLEGGKTEQIGAGMFCVHPRNTVHGLRNNRDETLVYIALSTGK